jgi:hypothetical protein
MGDDKQRQRFQYNPEAWRADELSPEDSSPQTRAQCHRAYTNPTIKEQTLVLDLLGRINYKILSGNRVYIDVGGVVYKTLYGGYWRSVFTGIEHYLLHCEKVSGAAWAEESAGVTAVDLPISYSKEGWTASGHSLSFMLSRDWT